VLGAGTLANDELTGHIAGCSTNDLLKQTFTLTSPARVYATSFGIYDSDDNTGHATASIRLVDESTNTVVAETNRYIEDFSGEPGFFAGRSLIALGEILRDAPPPPASPAPTAPTFVAQPGTYTVQLHLEASGLCATAPVYYGSLNYLLLANQ
jgi:hypothetical protein